MFPSYNPNCCYAGLKTMDEPNHNKPNAFPANPEVWQGPQFNIVNIRCLLSLDVWLHGLRTRLRRLSWAQIWRKNLTVEREREG